MVKLKTKIKTCILIAIILLVISIFREISLITRMGVITTKPIIFCISSITICITIVMLIRKLNRWGFIVGIAYGIIMTIIGLYNTFTLLYIYARTYGFLNISIPKYLLYLEPISFIFGIIFSLICNEVYKNL